MDELFELLVSEQIRLSALAQNVSLYIVAGECMNPLAFKIVCEWKQNSQIHGVERVFVLQDVQVMAHTPSMIITEVTHVAEQKMKSLK